jgi:hypothetical protein
VETVLPQSGNSNGAVALYRCSEERCRGTGRIPAGSGEKVSVMGIHWEIWALLSLFVMGLILVTHAILQTF